MAKIGINIGSENYDIWFRIFLVMIRTYELFEFGEKYSFEEFKSK